MTTKPVEDKHSKEKWKKKKKVGTNHPEWYIGKYAPSLVNLNFGAKKQGKYWPEGALQPGVNGPSVAALELCLTVPSDDVQSFRQAISTLYTKLRAVNSGTTVYSVDDLVAYVLNVRAIRALVAQIHKLVGVAQMGDIYDARIPESLIRGIFWTPSYVATISQLPQLRALGAQLDQQSRSMLPLNLPILDRTEWILGNVFADSDDVKPQYYEFLVRAITIAQITATNTYTYVHIDVDSVPDLLTVVAPILTTYLTNYITNVIAGDMIKAYGETAIRPLIDDWYALKPLQPVYDTDILQQIENANVLDWRATKPQAIWTPKLSAPGWINEFYPLSEPEWCNGVSVMASKPEVGCHIANGVWNSEYVNSYKDVVTPGELLAWTRLKFSCTVTGMNATDPNIITDAALGICGSEVVVNMRWIASDSTLSYIPIYPVYGVSDVNYENLTIIDHFDWHPMQYQLNNLYKPTSIGWDFKNFANVSYVDIDKLHQYANYAIVEPRTDFADQGRWAASKL